MPSSNPVERRLHATAAAYRSWANTADPSVRTAPAREAMFRKFEQQVDPDGVLDLGERQRRAEQARRAFYASMSAKSVTARRKAREAREAAVALDKAADDAERELRAADGQAGR